MHAIVGHFDELHFTECTFGEPILASDGLRIPAPRLVLVEGHPLCRGKGWLVCRGELVLLGARRSERRLIEYVGDAQAPTGFNPEVRIVDFSHPGRQALETFCFEGFSATRNAWIMEWKVEAQAFTLEVTGEGEERSRTGTRDV